MATTLHSIRIPLDLAAHIKALAQQQDRTFSNMVVHLLREATVGISAK